MKILHITPYYKPAYKYGGPVLSVGQLCENQAKLGNHITVFTTTADGQEELYHKLTYKEVDGVDVFYFPRIVKGNVFFSFRLIWALIIKIRRYDVIHIHTWWNFTALICTFICYLKKVRPIVSPRGMLTTYSFNHKNSFYKKFIHAIIGYKLLRFSHIQATSNIEKQLYSQVFHLKKVIILPNIIKLQEPQEYLFRKSETFRLLFLARVDPIKGIENLFEALRGLNFNYTLSIAGTGEDEYISTLKKKAADYNVENRIIWLGWLDNTKKFEVIKQHDLFVLPSLHENFANSVIESLNMGTPVLLSDQVGLCDYVLEREFGWVSSINPIDIQKNIELAYQNIDKSLQIRAKAPKVIYSDFNGLKLAEDYVNMYKQSLVTL